MNKSERTIIHFNDDGKSPVMKKARRKRMKKKNERTYSTDSSSGLHSATSFQDLDSYSSLTNDGKKQNTFFNAGGEDNDYYQPQQNTGIENGDYSQRPVTDEESLLQELEIDFSIILQKSISILNPFNKHRKKIRTFIKNDNMELLQDNEFIKNQDLIGPLIFGFLLGFILLLNKKVYFGNIYGCSAIGCCAIWILFNLMAKKDNYLSLWRTVSILGYGLIPVIIISLIQTLKNLLILSINPSFLMDSKIDGFITFILCTIGVIWSTIAATDFFMANLKLRNQYWLIGFPVALVFVTFILLTL